MPKKPLSDIEIARLQERMEKHAQEKSYLQLVNDLMLGLSRVQGIESTVEAVVRLILEKIGGTNVSVYYWVNNELHYADALGKNMVIERIDDPMVKSAFATGTFVEEDRDFFEAKMAQPPFAKSSCWAFPLKVNEKIIGVLKMDGMLISAEEMRGRFQPLFSYAALIVKNEIENYEQLAEANEELTRTNTKLAEEMTQRQAAESSLRITQFAVDHASDSLFLIRPDARFANVNDSTCRRLGYSREELLTMTVFDVDPAFPREAWDSHWREIKERKSFVIETKHRTKTGEVFPVEVSVNYVECEGAEYNFAFARDITERKQAEDDLREGEKQVRRKLNAILSPEANISTLELSDIIDGEKIQKMMDEFYRFTKIGIGIIDLHGKVLVGTGWQDICTKFHRINPETCRLCRESDFELTRDVPTGTFKQYRCKNNMWDIVSPIKLGDTHLGNIFLGQFLFDDETVDYEVFRQQAHRYGFNEQEYIAALDKVPRWNRKTVDAVMSFYAALAEMIGNLSYANVKLASALEERKRAEEKIRTLNTELEQRVSDRTAELRQANEQLKFELEERARVEHTLKLTQFAMDSTADVVFWLRQDGSYFYANKAASDLLGYTPGEFLKMKASDVNPEHRDDAWQKHWTELQKQRVLHFESVLYRKDGTQVPVEITANYVEFENQAYNCAFVRDITDRAQARIYSDMGRDILHVLNEPGALLTAMRQIIDILKTGTGFEAVGIRLQYGDDFPYFAHEGFPEDFLRTENTLVARDAAGGICRDTEGRVCLECTCGQVISDKTDPTNPYVTQGGSCWTNDKADSPFKDTRLHPRDRCLHEGFQSIALVPIRTNEGVVGLIQLNDRRKGLLTLDKVELLEGIASHISSALMRKQAEDALRDSEQRYRTLFEGVPDTILIADLETGIICDANPNAQRLFGMSREELVGMHQSKLHPARLTARTKQSFDEHARDAQAGKISGPFEHAIVRADGAEVPVEIVTQPITLNGKKMIQGVFRDISERKRIEQERIISKERLRALYDSITDALFVHGMEPDSSGRRFLEVNDVACRRLGYTREELLAMSPDAIDDPESGVDLNPIVAKIFAGETATFEQVHVAKDGTRIPVEISSHLFSLEGRQAVFSLVRDISDRKSMEQTLRNMNEELEQRVKDRTQELEQKNRELERMNKLFVGRELKMVELKEKIKALEKAE
jgi:PAS domain S-box-containing protein